jgi:hypothetical protein
LWYGGRRRGDVSEKEEIKVLNNMNQVREFIYRNRPDIDAFLEESELWSNLYGLFLEIKDNAYYLKIPAVTMFNEVRYQCVRVMLDKHPEENIWMNYLNDAKDTLGWRYASDLCFSLVFAVLSLMENPPKQVPFFLNTLLRRKLANETCYFPHVDFFVKHHQKVGNKYAIDFTPEAECPPKILKDFRWWQNVTNDFDETAIREILGLWENMKDKMYVLDTIENNYDVLIQQEQLAEEFDPLPF